MRIAVYSVFFVWGFMDVASVDAGPPEDAQILRALPKTCLIPNIVEIDRKDINIKTTEVRPGFWKCTIRYQEVIHLPSIGITFKRQRIHVIHFQTIRWIAGLVQPSRQRMFV
jgi:hypothetical protein